MVDAEKIKLDFPILGRNINGHPLIYLDNSATSQKPTQVLNAVSNYYKNSNANVHRGSHTLADESTSLYEKSREIVASFIGAKNPEQIVFVRNTTEAINLVAGSYAERVLNKDSKILLGIWEHHSNLVPWQQIARRTGAKLAYLNLTKEGLFDFEDYKSKLDTNTKIVAIAQASNVLGTIFPIKQIIKEAKKFGAVVLIDGAQSVPHMPVNVSDLDCDFLAFSGHKMLAPMGIGVLYVKSHMLDKLDVYNTGGGMILDVGLEESTWEKAPYKFEAGTPNVSGAVGLASSIEYLNNLGMENVRNHEIQLNKYALERFNKISQEMPNLHVLGSSDPTQKAGLLTFYFDNIHAHDVSTILDQKGVAVRSGFHCAMPLHKTLDIGPTCRASWYIYNTKEDIDILIEGILEAPRILL